MLTVDLKKIKLAIISDLHCHPKRDPQKDNDSTYLFSDILREHNHPIESLTNLLKDEKVDYILCPGDVTDKSDIQGFISGWNYILDLKEHFKAKKVIATVGNHDVDSRGNNDSYSYTNVKGIKKNYPFENTESKILENFYSYGYAIIEEEEIDFLVIDTCFYHHNKTESPNGKILTSIIIDIEEKLNVLDNNKYRILLLHHHPLMHSRKGLGEEDVLKNGSELITMIAKQSFDLVIHGHKHDPWLRFENGINIFSSGSFSAISNLLYTSDRNMFHIIELCEKNKGKIQTWTYFPETGWKVNFDDSTDIPPICGYGINSINDSLIDKIDALLPVHTLKNWSEILNEVIEVNFLPKQQINDLVNLLRNKDIIVETIGDYPTKLYKYSSNG